MVRQVMVTASPFLEFLEFLEFLGFLGFSAMLQHQPALEGQHLDCPGLQPGVEKKKEF